MLQALIECLEKFFPKDKFFPDSIELLDSEDEHEEEIAQSATFQSSETSTMTSVQQNVTLLQDPSTVTLPSAPRNVQIPSIQQYVTMPSVLQTFMLPPPQIDLPPLDLDLEGLLTPPFDVPLSQKEETIPRNMAVKSTAKPIRPEKVFTPPRKPLNRPEKQGSIAEYKTKTLKLKPASAYANPSERPKVQISIPYKHKLAPKIENFDPKNEAMKLNGIKEKIYTQLYLGKSENLPLNETSEISETNKSSAKDESNNSIESGKKIAKRRRSLLEEKKELTKTKLRKKQKRSYIELSTEASDDSESSSDEEKDFSKIPIQKSQSVTRRKHNYPATRTPRKKKTDCDQPTGSKRVFRKRKR
jgi:hypothetical protein